MHSVSTGRAHNERQNYSKSLDNQAFLKAKYCPRVAVVSRTQKKTPKTMWPWRLIDDLEIQ